MIQNGTNLRILIGDVVIPSLTSVSIDISRETITVTTSPSNGNIQRIPGTRDVSLSFDGYFGSDIDNLDVGELIDWNFTGRVSLYRGSGYITSLSRSAGTDSAPTYSGSIEGTGTVEQIIINSDQTLCDRNTTLCSNGEELRTLR